MSQYEGVNIVIALLRIVRQNVHSYQDREHNMNVNEEIGRIILVLDTIIDYWVKKKEGKK